MKDDLATEALLMAKEALTRIKSHEETCSERYSMIVKLLLGMIMIILGDIGLSVWPMQ